MNEKNKTVKKRLKWELILIFSYFGLAVIILFPFNIFNINRSAPDAGYDTEPHIEAAGQDIDLFTLSPETSETEESEKTEETTVIYWIEAPPPQTTQTPPPTQPPTQPPATAPPPTQPPTPPPTTAPPRVLKEGEVITGNATHYAVCCECDEPNTKNTASGHVLQNKVECYTVTCNWLPFGAVIEVDGIQYIVRDRGGRWFNTIGNIDIFVPEGTETALKIGRLRNIEIKIVSLP